MVSRSGIVLFFVVLHLCAAARAQAPVKTADEVEPEVEFFFSEKEALTIGVMGFVSKGGISQDKADVMADLLTDEISRMGDVSVIGESDIFSMFNLEKRQRLVGCDNISCISEIGGALGVRWMVTGHVSLFGKTYVLNLKLSDAVRAQVVSRATRKVTGEEDLLLVELSRAVHELFAPVGERLGLTMAETVSSAARHAQPIAQSPSAITVITREDIEASGAESIPDLLRMVPGMDVVMSSHFFTSVTARLYWNNENHHYLVLIDGRDINDELVGSAFWDTQPIFLDDVERIEIIRGPGSSLYGANALAGVISISTRPLTEKTTGWARAATGEPGMLMTGARLSTMISDWGISVSGGTEFSGKFSDPRVIEKDVWKVRAIAERILTENTRLVLEGGYTDGSGELSTALGHLDNRFRQGMLRLLYDGDDLRGQLYWVINGASIDTGSDLVFSGIRLAEFAVLDMNSNVVDGDVQWTLPSFYDPLMLIAGGRIRVSHLTSDDLLDPDYAVITSSGYHKKGMTVWETRIGAFIHGECAPTDWVTITGGARLDYNTITGAFVSPRLAAVFQPASGQYVRMGVSRAFRKPAAQETTAHIKAIFPDDSPITGTSQESFQEFLSRSIGNRDLENEKLLSFEAGYLGKYLDGELSVALDLYYNYHTDIVDFVSVLVPDDQGLPDLLLSRFRFENEDVKLKIIGSELSVIYSPSSFLSFRASWAHREVLGEDFSPKNLFTLGGRFRTRFGLLGSLYVFSRSEFYDRNMENPQGMMAPMLTQKMDNALLFLGKLGWKLDAREGYEVEAGVKLFLPFSPFSGPLFRYYERGGGVTPFGKHYGGEELSRAVTAYLQGQF